MLKTIGWIFGIFLIFLGSIFDKIAILFIIAVLIATVVFPPVGAPLFLGFVSYSFIESRDWTIGYLLRPDSLKYIFMPIALIELSPAGGAIIVYGKEKHIATITILAKYKQNLVFVYILIGALAKINPRFYRGNKEL